MIRLLSFCFELHELKVPAEADSHPRELTKKKHFGFHVVCSNTHTHPLCFELPGARDSKGHVGACSRLQVLANQVKDHSASCSKLSLIDSCIGKNQQPEGHLDFRVSKTWVSWATASMFPQWFGLGR